MGYNREDEIGIYGAISAAGAYLLPGRRCPPEGGGCGIREITYDTVLRKDLRMGYALGGLIRLPCRCVSARIPHQSAARSSPADSFSPGEAIAARCAAVAPEGRHIPFPAAR